MKNLKNKRGISLIVLVITIIVMIILATAIILSLNNSGIIGKANKAKNDSDTATLKEYVNTLKLDWEFMTAEEKAAAGSFSEYATSKLEEKGYKRIVTEDGIILTEGATAAVKAGIEIGDEVIGYNDYITEKSVPSYQTANGYGEQNISNTKSFVWKYVGLSDEGKLMILPELTSTSPKIIISGPTGFLNGVEELNRLSKVLYSTAKGTAESMDMDDVNKLLNYTAPLGCYWEWGEVDDPDYGSYDSPYAFVDAGRKITLQELNLNLSSNYFDGIPGIGALESNGYEIHKNSCSAATVNKNLVFSSYAYWLASQYCMANCYYGYPTLGIYASNAYGSDPSIACRGGITCDIPFYHGSSGAWADPSTSCLRPIVTLNAEVELIAPETVGGAWTIK